MDSINTQFVNQHFLLPGKLYVSKECTQVITVLGSCVAVCLYDTVTGIGGINHYMLPYVNNNIEHKLKYGDYSIDLLLKNMYKLGVKNNNLRAKIFGGASQFHEHSTIMNVGKQNIDIAHEMLSRYRIKIMSENVGGHVGRKIIFYSKSGVVYMKTLSRNIYFDNIER